MTISKEQYWLIASDAYNGTQSPFIANALTTEWERFEETSLISPSDSGFDAIAYRNGDDIVIAYRGFGGLADADDVASFALGDAPVQLRDAQAFYNAV